MRDLALYRLLDKAGVRNYRAKILLTAFLGTHLPLIALIVYVVSRSGVIWSSYFTMLLIVVLATVAGTAFTFLALQALLAPVSLTSRALADYMRSRKLNPLPTTFRDEVGALMASTADALETLEQARSQLENFDAVTNLPNRRKLLADLEPRKGAKPFAVCVFRLANFHAIAETFDLRAAETASAELAARLTEALGETRALYRIGAEDYGWVRGDGGLEPAALENMFRTVVARCSSDFDIGGIAVAPVLRVGVATSPSDADQPEDAVDFAIAAAADSHPINFHSRAARLATIERLRIEQDLRRAIERDEFMLHYQPVVDLPDGTIIGAEALIRWRHPQMGVLAPGKFIDVAESSGLIDPIGRWVLEAACRQLRSWSDSGLTGMKMAVNLSARQFLDADLIRYVRAAMDGAGVSPSQIEIELTETAAMADCAQTRTIFTRLRDCGISIAIDDFGVGYASMSYLRKLPFDKLKIDREFVADVHLSPENQAICSALSTLASGLGLRLLAEGVEKPEEVRFLRSRGCRLYQGYFFAKPMPASAFSEFARTKQSWRFLEAA